LVTGYAASTGLSSSETRFANLKNILNGIENLTWQRNWSAANEICGQLGLKLVSFDDAALHDKIRTLATGK
jgi:hypothetical protein